MKAAMAAVDGRADGKRVSGAEALSHDAPAIERSSQAVSH